MASEILEEVVEEANTLPPDEQKQFAEILNLMMSLHAITQIFDLLGKMRGVLSENEMQTVEALRRVRNSLAHGQSKHEQARRIALSRSIRGKYAHLPISSEEFIALKRKDTKLEDSKLRDHQ